MPTPKKGARLGKDSKHQKAMLSNLAVSLFDHERIKTTEAKAKMLRPYAEKLITKAKKGDVHNRRRVLSVIEDREIVHKLFADIAPRFADRNGGYTRILKLGPRNGDNAPMVLMELVEGAAAVATSTDEPAEEGGRRKRLSRPARRKGASTDPSLPQDKPARSKAAEAAAAGTPGGDADVEPPPDVEAEGAEAELATEATAAEDSSADAEANLADAPANTSADGGQADSGDAGESGKR